MRKRILILILAVVLSTGSVMQTEIKAEAAATTTVVTLAKAILVLLAIAGVGVVSGSIFENDGNISEATTQLFTTWLNGRDPEFYTEFMVAASAVAAGRLVNPMNQIFLNRLRSYAREYFGTSTSTTTSVGTQKIDVSTLAFLANGSQYIQMPGYGNVYSRAQNISYIGFKYNVSGSSSLWVVFLQNNRNATGFSIPFDYGREVSGLVINGHTDWTRVYEVTGSNITLFDTELTASSQYSMRGTIQTIVNNFVSGKYSYVDSNVLMRPFATVGNVAATSVDATVVGAGQTVAEQNGEIVIDGDTTYDLSNINIDEWLKSLADGVTSYADAMTAIGLSAVNTQTQTLAEIQSIVAALNPAAAGTQRITGNYTVSLADLFPFCIPFDLFSIINCFNAEPVAPSVTISLPVGFDGSQFTWEDYEISLAPFDQVAQVARIFEYVLFVIGLMLVTRKLIEG